MLTPLERVLILKGADILKDVGPRRLLGLADIAREIEIIEGDTIYREDEPADAMYLVVEGRVRLLRGDRAMSEVGPGEAFGSWSLVDDSGRVHRADCIETGLVLALHRDEFYDVAAGDLTLLQGILHALARRLRALAAGRPDEARVEGEGIVKPQALAEAEAAAAAVDAATAATTADAAPPTSGATLAAAALGVVSPPTEPAPLPPPPAQPPRALPPSC
ncbi:MAG: Crp/Fnr family transcriptional regulator [bacterium]